MPVASRHNGQMNEPLAYFNGEYLPLSQAVLPVWDAGFVLGTTIIEQLRTFGGKLFHVEGHLDRLFRSLEIAGVDPDISKEELAHVASQLVERNRLLIEEEDDLGISIFVTPGDAPSITDGETGSPRVVVHTFPLAFGLWADKYADGQKLVITNTRHVPNDCWPAEMKCRSRMHYHLADREARTKQPGARALLLNTDGHVTESSTANVVLYRDDTGLIAPPVGDVLPGLSMRVLFELAENLHIETTQKKILPVDVFKADEVLMSSTPFCVLPVTQVDDTPVSGGQPGPIFQKLLAAFDQLVGLDIASQAQRFACRKTSS